jgi:hypothetical protein
VEHESADFFARVSDDLGELRIAAKDVAFRRGVNDAHRSLLKETPTF